MHFWIEREMQISPGLLKFSLLEQVDVRVIQAVWERTCDWFLKIEGGGVAVVEVVFVAVEGPEGGEPVTVGLGGGGVLAEEGLVLVVAAEGGCRLWFGEALWPALCDPRFGGVACVFFVEPSSYRVSSNYVAGIRGGWTSRQLYHIATVCLLGWRFLGGNQFDGRR